MKSQPLTGSPTIADLWSDLYETWTRTLVFPWTLGDPSERKAAELSGPAPSAAGFAGWQTAWDYWVDAWQRTVLFWDVLRQRSEQYYAEKAKAVPHVLSFDAELVRPELFGPIILAGSPLSYWAGVEGQSPMRYSGGLLGGSWLTALTSDLGAGKFDGAHLVANFENSQKTRWW